MLITTVNKRYAKSLLDFALEQDKVEEVKRDVGHVLDVMEDSREFRLMLKSPVIRADKKEQVIDAVFKSNVEESTLHFIKIVIRHGREGQLEETMRSFIVQYRRMKGIEEAVITSAHPLTEAQRSEISDKLAEVTGNKMEIVEKVDASLIGGLKVRVGDRQYNGSIASQLDELRRKFSKNEFVADI